MEVQVHKRRLTLLLALVVAVLTAAQPLWAGPQNKKERTDSLVRIMKAESLQQLEKNGIQYRKAIASTFLHNGTYLISDTALWNMQSKVINCWGHVKVIQDETILTSEKLDYYIDDNLAQFRGTLVQLQNKKRNTLRTRYLDYNTQDSLAVFRSGASMRDEKGQVIESNSGTYSSRDKRFQFNDNVNMFSDSVFVKTNQLLYDSETEVATFPTFIDFWKGGNMLSAGEGWYDRRQELFFFRRNVHGLSPQQEVWSDSLYYYQAIGDVVLKGLAQVQDTSRKVTAMADFIHFQDSISQVTLRKRAAVALETTSQGKRDTIYIGADTLIYKTIKMCDIPEGTISASKSRLTDILTDAVTEYRRKAAAEAAAAKAEAEKQGQMQRGVPARGGKNEQQPEQEEAAKPAEPAKSAEPAEPVVPAEPAEAEAAKAAADSLARRDSLMAPLHKAVAAVDSLVGAVRDSTALGIPEAPVEEDMDIDAAADTLAAQDSLAAAADTLSAASDSLASTPKDTTKIGFAYALHNVKIFRKDIQARCDSLCYCDLDSVARFYLDPVIWNEGNRQYTSDSVFVLVGAGGPRKASLQANAFVITQQDSIRYDQIKGAEIMAYFDTLENTLRRFDALGGASALFYLEENGSLATVNKVETKMLSAIIKDNNIDQVYYFEQPKNNAYPVVQLPKEDHSMKGFKWRPDERPATSSDVAPLSIRRSQRSYFLSKPMADFRQTEIYFPGYIPNIRREIAIRDSLAKIPRPHDSFTIRDSLALADSLAVLDSLAQSDTLVVRDSLVHEAVPQQRDSTAAVTATPDEDPLAVPTIDPKHKKKEEQELKRKLRIARRDARIAAREKRWEELDRRDSLKVEAKKQKALEKERAKKLRRLLAIKKQEAKDQARLEKYIEKYRKQYERKQKRDAARKRSQGAPERGEVPTPPESGEAPAGSDAVLSNDGTADDSPVLGGSSLPGT